MTSSCIPCAGMPYLERCCLETKRLEYREVLDVTRIMHMLQKRHIITSQLEAIILADPSFSGRVDRLLDILMSRGPQVIAILLAYICMYSGNIISTGWYSYLIAYLPAYISKWYKIIIALPSRNTLMTVMFTAFWLWQRICCLQITSELSPVYFNGYLADNSVSIPGKITPSMYVH